MNSSYLKEVKNVFFIVFILITGFLAVIPVVTYATFVNDFSTKESIMNKNKTGVILLDRHDRPFFEFYQPKFLESFMPISEIPVHVRQAVIAVEDKEFYAHSGFSLKAIIRSFFTDIMHQDIITGGSTITQQLVKNVFLTPEKSYLRKYKELILAQEIDGKYSKDEILELYLNSVYFGEGAFGIENAARTYFNKKPNELTIAQSAMLAGLLSSPSATSPISGNLIKAKKRQLFVLEQMLKEGYISREQMTEAENEDLNIAEKTSFLNKVAPHFALMIRDKLIAVYGEEVISRSGFKVKTTIDLDFQEYAETVVRNQVATLAPNNVSNASVVVLDPKTGEIKSMVGSVDWNNEVFGKVNVALSERQPGSSFKPIVYSAALERGIITPASILDDRPVEFEMGYKPKNYDGRFRGKVTVRKSLANSLNIPSVEIINMLGVQTALKSAQKLGISTLKDPSNYGLSLVLGAGEVRLLELTNAYATFANNGEKNEIVDILSIEDKEGKIIYENKPFKSRVLSKEVAYLISSILSDQNARREVFGNVLDISRRAAVKTGTTESYKDSLTLGYTPNVAIGVWVGNNDGAPMDNIAGSLGAAPIWKQLMEQYLLSTPFEDFERPDGIVALRACNSRSQTEFFIKGTEPAGFCFVDIPNASPSASPGVSAPTLTPSITPLVSPTPTLTPSPTFFPTPSPTPTEIPTPSITTPTLSSPFPTLSL